MTAPAPTELVDLLDLVGPRLAPVALAAARLAPVVWLAPGFGGRRLPAPVRVLITAVLAATCAPEAGTVTLGAAALVREAAVGLVLGLLAALPFELARSGGQAVDTVRGAALVQALVPTLDERASAVGDLLYLALLVAVTSAGGDRLLLAGLAEGFAALPAGAPWTADGTGVLAVTVLDAGAGLVAAAAALAAPAIAASLLVDGVLGIAGRMAPELPVFFVGLPARALVGLAVVALALPPVLARLGAEADAVPAAVCALAAALGGTP